jgi:phospholipase C
MISEMILYRLIFILTLSQIIMGCGIVYSSGNPNPVAQCLEAGQSRSNIQHVVVIIQENHSFDSYFANYCTAPVGSNPTCTTGPECCETGPTEVSGVSPTVLTDSQNIAYDPNHFKDCELSEINGGLMNGFVSGIWQCSDPQNFAYADAATVSTYWNYAKTSALADRFFQPAAGASTQNDMYLARAEAVFIDDMFVPTSIGAVCYPRGKWATYKDPTIGDLLNSCGVSWSFYSEGYQTALSNPLICTDGGDGYDPTDNPFQYFDSLRDNPRLQKDYTAFAADIASGNLPSVSYVKGNEAHNEHPGSTITEGEMFVTNTVAAVLNSPIYQNNTLILLMPDESGGFYDHVSPPPTSPVDGQPYGSRIPFLAIGYFAKPNSISHVVMEHSSIVRFIEWNFLDGEPGQLGTRDATVNGIGSLLDPAKTGQIVP